MYAKKLTFLVVIYLIVCKNCCFCSESKKIYTTVSGTELCAFAIKSKATIKVQWHIQNDTQTILQNTIQEPFLDWQNYTCIKISDSLIIRNQNKILGKWVNVDNVINAVIENNSNETLWFEYQSNSFQDDVGVQNRSFNFICRKNCKPYSEHIDSNNKNLKNGSKGIGYSALLSPTVMALFITACALINN